MKRTVVQNRMSRVLSFLLLLTFAIGGISSNRAFLIGATAKPEPNISSKDTLDPAERIRRVERGLLLPIVIAGPAQLNGRVVTECAKRGRKSP